MFHNVEDYISFHDTSKQCQYLFWNKLKLLPNEENCDFETNQESSIMLPKYIKEIFRFSRTKEKNSGASLKSGHIPLELGLIRYAFAQENTKSLKVMQWKTFLILIFLL